MKYKTKTMKKILKNISSENGKEDYYKRLKKLFDRRLEIYSRGGELERSHKKRVGNIVKKDVENRYSVADKVFKNIGR
jgi:hypothetical protein